MAKKDGLTPAMKQYFDIKKEHPESILLFRMGDFYETFFEDARIISRELNIVLTARGRGSGGEPIPLAGVPFHALDTYLSKLVRKGHRVVIVEQVEDPKKAKGLVKREVVRVVTPGTAMEDSILSGTRNNYLVAISPSPGLDRFGVAAIEISTGDFTVTEVPGEEGTHTALLTEISRISPAEMIAPSWFLDRHPEVAGAIEDVLEGCAPSHWHDQHFVAGTAGAGLKRHFGVMSLEGLGLETLPLARSAAWAALSYVKDTQFNDLSYINRITVHGSGDRMMLDHTTLRNLEIVRNIVDNSQNGTLLSVLDRTGTAMGARMMRAMVVSPETDVNLISRRQDAVQSLMSHPMVRSEISDLLGDMNDLERIMSRVCFGSASIKDLAALRSSLKLVPELMEKLSAMDPAPPNGGSDGFLQIGKERTDQLENGGRKEVRSCTDEPALFSDIMEGLRDMGDLVELLDRAIVDNPPAQMREGGMIRDGYSGELDEMKGSIKEAKTYIADLEGAERSRTGIKGLKVGFNKVFGYYLEIPNSFRGEVPGDYIRKQTLANCERYITTEMKAQEAVVLSAQERINDMEYELFCGLRSRVADRHMEIREIARAVATLDVMVSFARVSEENGYVRPQVDRSDIIHIVEGRHPVVENLVDDPYVPNDTSMDPRENRIMILTGPNMAGKSTYMRQAALISIMAQLGCFVPARFARLGVLDRVFTRVGAHDDLLRGQSTFMVEMVQLANILNNATPRSLAILDEIGRGTSTFDGLSLAWAVIEFLQRRCPGTRVMFATHYHHLTELANVYDDVHNYQVLVEERGDEIIFVRRIVPGAADKSYGIEVARLAGLPVEVIERARTVLRRIEEENILDTSPGETAVSVSVSRSGKGKGGIKTYTQYVLFPFEDRGAGKPEREKETVPPWLQRELDELDPDMMMPVDALLTLKRWKEMAEGKKD